MRHVETFVRGTGCHPELCVTDACRNYNVALEREGQGIIDIDFLPLVAQCGHSKHVLLCSVSSHLVTRQYIVETCMLL